MLEALPGVLGIQGEGLFIFRDLGSRVIYFQGFGEKAQFLGVLGSRKQGAEEKHFRELGRKAFFLSGSREQRPPPPWGSSMLPIELSNSVKILKLLGFPFICPRLTFDMEY